MVFIEAPVDEWDMAEFSNHNHPIHSDILRYYEKRFFKAENNNAERAGDIALLETVNRYLDPHGFEYIDKENSQEEKHETTVNE